MAIKLRPEERDPRVMVDSINQLIEGRSNTIGEVTFTPGAALTVVNWVNASKDSRVFLSPRTANAGAAMNTWHILDADYVQGGFTIRHANNAQADRHFWFHCVGG